MVYRVILIVLIRAYQRLISPFIPASCRFYPSCSEYAIQAVGHYGLLWGTAKAAWRLLRCNPLCRGGVDLPIPTGGDPV